MQKLVGLLAVGILAGCSQTATKSPDVSDSIRKSLDQAGFKDVTVSQDRDKGIVTLGGQVASENDKSQARGVLTSCMKGFEGSAGDSGFLRRLLRCLGLSVLFGRELAALDVARVYFRVVLPLFG